MIAISYRREDSLAIAGRLYDRLETKFGQQNVFMDFDTIRPGLDFRQQIKEIIERSSVVVAMIGPHWVGEQENGSRRIDDPTDFVRLEIEYALKRGIPIIPVLINSTPMPKAERLPDSIKELAFRHALPLDSGLDFRQHAERLIAAVQDVLPLAGGPRPNHRQSGDSDPGTERRRLFVWGAIIFLVAIGAVTAWLVSRPSPEQANTRIAPHENAAQVTPTSSAVPVVIERPTPVAIQPRIEVSAAPAVTPSNGNLPAVITSNAASNRETTATTSPQKADIFAGTWEGTYNIDSTLQDGTPTRGPFRMRMIISAGHAVLKTPASQCDKWVGSGPGILACFGRDGVETLTVNEDGETAAYFMAQDYTNLTGTLRKTK